MATDYWPDKEGYIFEGCMVLPVQADGSITEMCPLLLNATVAGYISVDETAAAADSFAVALRAADTDEIFPAAFNGVVKMVAGCTIALGDSVVSKGTAASSIVVDCDTFDGAAAASQHLGIALQGGGTTGDEILVLLGGRR